MVRGYGEKAAKRAWFSAKFNRRAFVVFLTGFLAGLALVHIWQTELVQNTSLLDHAALEGMGALAINKKGLLFYSLRQRLLPAGLLILAAAAGAGTAAVCLFLLWSGFCAGALLSVLSLRYGIRGVILFAGGIFPQVFFLVPAFLLICGWCAAFTRKGERRIMAGTRSGRFPFMDMAPLAEQKMSMSGRLSADVGTLLTALGMLIFGCVIEGYVSPAILGKVLFLF